MFGQNKNEKSKEVTGIRGNSVDLSDVIRGMQDAVNEAQHILELHNLKSLQSFFHEDGEPKTLELHLTGDDYLEIPVLSLANHNSLVIDRLSMEFEAKIEQVGIKNAKDVLDAITQEDEAGGGEKKMVGKDRSAVFGIGFAGGSEGNTVKVKMEFASAARAEGLSRILDEYNKLVVPYKAGADEDNSPWRDKSTRFEK
ncbi:MAG: DUF2589 domain-containing protein [Treponema sp.]|nr:DUF2589 domain-containing protein [Treponema sp.]